MRKKCLNRKFFLVRFFPHLDWIRRDTSYLSVFSQKVGKYGPETTAYLDTFHTVAVEIMCCTDEKLVKSLLDAFPERFEFECLQISPPFSDKEKFVKKIEHHCSISGVNEEMDSFKPGLSTTKVFEIRDIRKSHRRYYFTMKIFLQKSVWSQCLCHHILAIKKIELLKKIFISIGLILSMK